MYFVKNRDNYNVDHVFAVCSCLLFVLGDSTGVLGVSDICPDNSVNYAGEYRFVIESSVGYGNDTVKALGPFSSVKLISPGEAKYSYVQKKWTPIAQGDGSIMTDNSFIDEQDFENIPVETMCMAPPQSGAGLVCADVKDDGVSRIIPIEVDRDCNMLKGWNTYLEATLPGCEAGSFCSYVSYVTLTRLNASLSEAVAQTAASGATTSLRSLPAVFGVACYLMLAYALL